MYEMNHTNDFEKHEIENHHQIPLNTKTFHLHSALRLRCGNVLYLLSDFTCIFYTCCCTYLI